MVSDIYMFDLETLRWEKIAQSPGDDVPQARYFHSADACTLLRSVAPSQFASGPSMVSSCDTSFLP